MNNWPNLIPTTASIAIAIFAIKEILEFFRRRNGDERKIHALKTLLARECELNYWTIKSLRRIVNEIPTNKNENFQISVTIEKTPSGRPFAKVTSDDGGMEAHYSIPKTHRELMSKFLLDIAMLDKKLFTSMEPAYDGVAELEHIRESLINTLDAPNDIGQKGYLEGFAEYGLSTLDKVEKAIGTLYSDCTGNPLSKHRLR